MTQTQIPDNGAKTQSREPDLHSALITELDSIVREAEKPKKPETEQVAHWYYSVPCAGVHYYTYHKETLPAS